jgi:hypothetical protein
VPDATSGASDGPPRIVRGHAAPPPGPDRCRARRRHARDQGGTPARRGARLLRRFGRSSGPVRAVAPLGRSALHRHRGVRLSGR